MYTPDFLEVPNVRRVHFRQDTQNLRTGFKLYYNTHDAYWEYGRLKPKVRDEVGLEEPSLRNLILPQSRRWFPNFHRVKSVVDAIHAEPRPIASDWMIHHTCE